jgi:hypothetical protein
MRRRTKTALVLAGLASFLVMPKKRNLVNGIEDETTEPTGFRSRIVAIAASQLGENNRTEYAADALGLTSNQAIAQGTDKLSWCGLFATWVLQQAGADVNWVLGKGVCYQLPRTSNPQPGDLAYIDQPYQHHAIVTGMQGAEIQTIDGNSTGGVVAINERPRSAFTAFYDVSSLNPDVVV